MFIKHTTWFFMFLLLFQYGVVTSERCFSCYGTTEWGNLESGDLSLQNNIIMKSVINNRACLTDDDTKDEYTHHIKKCNHPHPTLSKGLGLKGVNDTAVPNSMKPPMMCAKVKFTTKSKQTAVIRTCLFAEHCPPRIEGGPDANITLECCNGKLCNGGQMSTYNTGILLAVLLFGIMIRIFRN
ncbi:uncharacterized protein LOC141907875 [Tubulanus polymorphus]|uniref:uncharacterized protein LOC141907875 n=1 Tax=Tubulanus polymorphus TaxID=672921 RepID=UPI003DA23DDE